MEISLLYGRRELVAKINQESQLPPTVKQLPTLEVGTRIHCLRCNAETPRSQGALPHHQYYCPRCINLGRVSTLDQFYHVPEPNYFPPCKDPLSWHGTLSPLQKQIAEEVKASLAKHEERLLWAVTGAGKTEMIFPTIAQAICNQERICIASPRVDVCMELFPRLQAAFKTIPMILLHGKHPEPYQYCQITVCTTHQLLRFYHAFDLLIVDEVDAFPYAANQQLLFATQQAKKTDGGLLLMTATPGRLILQKIRRRQLAVSYLPLRYHGYLLPEIQCIRIGNGWQRHLERQRLPFCLRRWIARHLSAHKRFLLFVPHVSDLTSVQAALRCYFRTAKFTTVHAADEQRLVKVQGMRDHQYDFLVTTTILERGVTFPGIDVAVLGADEDIFSSSALVQIAGRVGRSANCPSGEVSFFIKENTRSVQEAINQIKHLNRLGRKLQCKNV